MHIDRISWQREKTWSRQLFTTTHDMDILNGIYCDINGNVIQMVSMVSN